jgi:carboxyl-terminal processing protease
MSSTVVSLLRTMCVSWLAMALFTASVVAQSSSVAPRAESPKAAAASEASQDIPRWWAINTDAGYRLEGGGDVLSKQGADVRVILEGGTGSGFGGSGVALDATPYRGQQIVLSATLHAKQKAYNGALWLRADDAAGTSVAFMNTQEFPVFSSEGAQYREAFITVPDTATRLVLGTIMNGIGSLHAKRMVLEVRAPTPAKPGDGKGQTVLDAAIDLVKTHALRMNRIDWATFEPELRAETAQIRDSRDAYPAIRHMLKSLGDRHSRLIPPAPARQHEQQVPSEAVEVKSLPGGIGYIGMPGFGSADRRHGRAFVRQAAERMASTSQDAENGWVVDLRKDHGGNMFPMIAALSPMLGDDTLGYFERRDGKREPWRVDSKLKPNRDLDLRNARVAVLIGPGTASSGEATALSFRGRANTRFFGQPSAGVSTANRVFTLPDGSLLVLTTAMMLDRNGRGDGEQLMPDESTPVETEGSDPAMDAAVEWLSLQH